MPIDSETGRWRAPETPEEILTDKLGKDIYRTIEGIVKQAEI